MKDPRIKKIEIMNNRTNIISSDEMIRIQKANSNIEDLKKEEKEEPAESTSTKSILKTRSYNRRIVSASIRDSLELLGKTPEKSSKSVRWDRLYYDDNSMAEFGNDGKPVAALKKKGKKAGTKPAVDKKQIVVKGKKKKTSEPVEMMKINKMVTRNNQYSIVPRPSSGPNLRT